VCWSRAVVAVLLLVHWCAVRAHSSRGASPAELQEITSLPTNQLEAGGGTHPKHSLFSVNSFLHLQ
jgi:hypothetical protein